MHYDELMKMVKEGQMMLGTATVPIVFELQSDCHKIRTVGFDGVVLHMDGKPLKPLDVTDRPVGYHA